MSDLADIGLVGLGVMGANLALNMAEKGHRVAILDRDPGRLARLTEGALGRQFTACTDPRGLLAAIRPPRPVILLVPSGEATDKAIRHLVPHLAPDDILMDAGNANFRDTRRRAAELAGKGFAFVGLGISGGAEGARRGPAIMVGGPRDVWGRIAPVLRSIAARYQAMPCADWLGPDGAGHFVKTIHNGIEYAIMQMIAEAYGMLRDGMGKTAFEISEIFLEWSEGTLQSYLVESAAEVAASVDPESGAPMLDLIADRAGQKGTGRWSVVEAAHLGGVASTVEAAVSARNISADTRARQAMPHTTVTAVADLAVTDLHDALLFGNMIAYAQGFDTLSLASRAYEWSLDPAQIARVWRAGCIIRATMLDGLSQALTTAPEGNLVASEPFARQIRKTQPALRRVCGVAVASGLPAPALLNALSYYDQMARPRGTANMLQGLRDFFGHHGFERTDRPGDGHHGPWVARNE